ncbi:MAG: hypothetical protein VYE64_05595 [Planctomycetota bacterium]|nr:hypothetical protein [Planctomycetota bacterium]
MGRQSVWSDQDIQTLSKKFVLAADEVWRLQGGYDFRKYQAAGGNDPECVCFQEMAADGHYGPGGGTKQGIYVCTPAGKLLGSINSLSADAVRKMMERSLAAWQALPEADRLARPAPLKPAHRWEWSAPAKGLILKETIRYLTNEAPETQTPEPRFNHDFAWFSADEARRLIPESPTVGATYSVPPEIYRRLARCHLLNTAHGEGGTYQANQIEGDLTVTILQADAEQIHIQLRGQGVSTGSREKAYGLAPAARIRTELFGVARFDLASGQFDQFELVVLGKLYSSNDAVAQDPVDKNIGWYFTLADPQHPFDRLPPTHLHAYDAAWVAQPNIRLHDYQPIHPSQK